MARAFVIDSNFYISVSRTRIEGALEELINWSREGHGELHTSLRVLEEIRTVPNYGTKSTMVELVERHFKVHDISSDKIVALQRLIGVSAAPQDTDLSLMALCAELTAQGNTTTLVTDDFKITKTAPKIPQHFEVISPSVFLMQVSNECEGNRKARFKDLHRKVRRFEIEYMLSRRDIYDAQPKLDWLIDSMIGSLAATAGGQRAAPAPPASVPTVPDAAPGEELDDLHALERYLKGEKVRPSKLRMFEHMIPYTTTLHDLDHVRREVGKLAGEGQAQKALETVDRRLNGMKTELQVGFASIPPKDADVLFRVFSPKMADLQYLAAMIHLSLGEMDQGEARLNDTALLGLFAENGGVALEANYLLSLIYLYQLEYEQAAGQFALVDLLAQRLMRTDARTRALVGKALSDFLRGESSEAAAAMVDVYHAIEDNPAAGAQVLEDFGDHLANFSLPQMAVDFYEEAMECAVEADDFAALDRLVQKAKRSHFATGRSVGEVATKIGELVSRAHYIKSDVTRARFEAEKANMLQMVASMQGPLPYVTKDWVSGGDLPLELRETMEVSSIVQNRLADGAFETVAIAYAPSLGKIAVYLPAQLAERDISRAAIHLNEGGHFKVLPAPKELADIHEARAIVGSRGSNDITVDRVSTMTSFFPQARLEK